MANKAQIRDRAASDLGRLRLGQSLQSQDATRIESAYDEVYADLKDEGLNIWPSTGSAPTACVPHMAALVAENCLNTYSVSTERFQRIMLAAGNAKREIRRLVTAPYESQDDPADF